MNTQQWNSAIKGEQLAQEIANAFDRGRKHANSMMQQERDWVQQRYRTVGLSGRTGRLHSMREDEGTLFTVQEYIARMQQPGYPVFTNIAILLE